MGTGKSSPRSRRLSVTSCSISAIRTLSATRLLGSGLGRKARTIYHGHASPDVKRAQAEKRRAKKRLGDGTLVFAGDFGVLSPHLE